MWRPRPILTQIVATLGPASNDAETIRKLVESGASVFRINFSHGTLDAHAAVLAAVREVEAELGQPIGVLGDLAGPKIRVGQVMEGGVRVETGQDILIQREAVASVGPCFSTTYPGLIDDVREGERLLIADGAIRTIIVERRPDHVVCRVTAGGLISTGKGINLPNTQLRLDTLTERDWQCMEWAVNHDLDFIGLSFVRRAEEILTLRRRMKDLCDRRGCRPIPIVAKIERPEALENIEEILEVTDAIMVARGDLGVEMDLAEVPAIQKRLVDLADQFGKPCIVATQMLESMIESPSPTRAEASDVANAILDGVDAVMLSGETAVGKYPVVVVETMARIAEATEAYLRGRPVRPSPKAKMLASGHWTAAIAHAAWSLTPNVQARVIFATSESGSTALHLSRNNFQIPLVIGSHDRSTLRRITLLHGVVPVELPVVNDLDDLTAACDRILLASGLVEHGAPVIIVAGHPLGRRGTTNSLALHYVGDPATGYRRSRE